MRLHRINKSLEDHHENFINLDVNRKTNFVLIAVPLESFPINQIEWGHSALMYLWSLNRDMKLIWNGHLSRSQPPRMRAFCFHGYLNKEKFTCGKHSLDVPWQRIRKTRARMNGRLQPSWSRTGYLPMNILKELLHLSSIK